MTAVKNKIKTIFRSRKINSFLLFLLMAFGILVLTKLSKNYTSTIHLKVEAKQLPDEVVILNDSTKTLKLTITTHGFKWLRYYLKPPKIAIDFSQDVSKTDNTYEWSSNKGYSSIIKQFGEETKIESIKPDTLLFKYDVNAVKMLPVILNTNINYSLGYDVMETIKSNPDSIKVIGPDSVLSKMSFIESEILIMEDVNESIDEKVILKLDSISPLVTIKSKSTNLVANVEKFTEGKIDVPVTIINIPKGKTINYFPKTVTVSYYTSLSLFNNIITTDFKIICDFKNADVNSHFLTPELVSQPAQIKSARIQQQSVEFIISE